MASPFHVSEIFGDMLSTCCNRLLRLAPTFLHAGGAAARLQPTRILAQPARRAPNAVREASLTSQSPRAIAPSHGSPLGGIGGALASPGAGEGQPLEIS